MTARSSHYDLIAIGAGPAAQAAAIQASALGRRAAVVDRDATLGGESTTAGAIAMQTLRAAVIELTGQATGAYRNGYRSGRTVTVDDLFWRTRAVMQRAQDGVHDRLRRSGVDLLAGSASFVDPQTLVVAGADARRSVTADRFVIAAGTRAARPADIAFDDRTVLDSDGILGLARVPRRLTVVGGGVIGLEYASIFAALGVHVTLVDGRARVLDLVDPDVVDELLYHLQGRGVVLRLSEAVSAVERSRSGTIAAELRGGGSLLSDALVYAGGRRGATDDLGLAAAGLAADARGRIAVGADYRTAQPHILAAGDVIGAPGRASAAAEQGRLAALSAFGRWRGTRLGLVPTGVFTIPEIASVGEQEQTLRDDGVPYVLGLARYRELPRGEIAGDRAGLLKLVVHTETRRLLGVHVLGTAATELVHVGQAVIAGSLTVDYLTDAVFTAPAFAEGYRVAAIDAAERLETFAERSPRAA